MSYTLKMNYNSKRLINPLKPICKCKTVEFNTLIDIVCGSASTKEHNKNLAFRKAIEELTSPCIDKEFLTLAEIVKIIPYTVSDTVDISCDVFDADADVKPNGFFILVGEDKRIIYIASLFYNNSVYRKNDSVKKAYKNNINSMRFPLNDKDITIIKKALPFEGVYGTDYTSDPRFTTTLGSGTIYMYKLNGTA